ncbi:MAG: hypothetical protein JWQ24_481 [Tardiphaga sp.]|nr:hypothetical protein [Tardiphaga sp.]
MPLRRSGIPVGTPDQQRATLHAPRVAQHPGNESPHEKAAGIAAGGLRSVKRDNYFGYLNSGAAFNASLVVFMVASHLLFLVSYLTLTDDGETAT